MSDTPVPAPGAPQSPTHIQFQLFRIALTNPTQIPLGSPPGFTDQTRPQILLDMLLERPTLTTPKGHTWRVGNPRPVGPFGVLFKFGRDTTKRIEKVNESGDFVDEVQHAAGSSQILLDLSWSVLAISRPKDLPTEFSTLARRLAQVLQNHPAIAQREAKVTISALHDTREFFELIENAEKILWLSIGFSLPNPDDDDDATKAFEEWAQKSGASGGAARVNARNGRLNLDVLKPTMQTAAARGNTLSGKVIPEGETQPKKIDNKKSVVTMSGTADGIDKDPTSAFDRMVSNFTNVRGIDPSAPRQLPPLPRWPPADQGQKRFAIDDAAQPKTTK